MSPLAFEARYRPLWQELEDALRAIEKGREEALLPWRKPSPAGAQERPDPARLAQLYRAACEHLALAQARSYPIAMTERLERITYAAHHLIYRQRDFGGGALHRLVHVAIPQSVRRHRRYLEVAAALFFLPTILAGLATWLDPTFALHVVDIEHLEEFRAMYADGDHALGRPRGAEGDWTAFAFYILNNISIAFQCFAGGIFAGVGSAFFLVYNGAFSGAIAGYVGQLGLGRNFFSFVVTHSAFELTAICLSGGAGLRLGHALVFPGRYRRLEALRVAASEAVVLVYAAFGMLLIAAAIEAFWSSAPWVAAEVKYATGAASWILVGAYLLRQGRPLAPARESGRASGEEHAP